MALTINDECGNPILQNASEEDVISLANTIFYYDQKDEDEEEFADFNSSKTALETISYKVVEDVVV